MGLEEASPRNNGGRGKENQARKRQSQSELHLGSVYCRQHFIFIRQFRKGGVRVGGNGEPPCPRSKRK